MGWLGPAGVLLDTLFGASPKTFEQDLELLVARWTTRDDAEKLSVKQVAVGLAIKARALTKEAAGEPDHGPVRPSQGA
jgi:hypothetical protein